MVLQLLRLATILSHTLDPPVFAKPFHLDTDKLAVAKAEFSALKKAGIIRYSTSPWSSMLHMVKKKDGV